MAEPIDTALKDGTAYLLFFPFVLENGQMVFEGGWIEGYYFSSPKEIDNGWETIIGSIGEPTHWLPLPEDPTLTEDK